MKFTAFDHAAMIRMAKTTKPMAPKVMNLRSRAYDRWVEAGDSPSSFLNIRASTANDTAMKVWPISLARLFRPRLRCLRILM